MLVSVVRFLNAFHDSDKVNEISAAIAQGRIAFAVAKTVKNVFSQRYMELALIAALMNWVRANQLIAFSRELLRQPVVFENLLKIHRLSHHLNVYPLLCHTSSPY